MMTSKKALGILQLNAGAELAQIKQAYRRLAFSLHPDLNPKLPNAAKSFQNLNEAYVFLLHLCENEERHKTKVKQENTASSKAYDEAQKAYSKASAEQKERQGKKDASANQKDNQAQNQQGDQRFRRKEDVLNDILNDPFAKRVFEDIYRHIKAEQGKHASHKKNKGQKQSAEKTDYSFCHKRSSLEPNQKERKGLLGKIKAWLRRQIDDEQILSLPSNSIVPGARLRLDIQHGLGSDTHTVEIILPPDFSLEKKVRLQGLGKRLGSLRGDLYVRIQAQ